MTAKRGKNPPCIRTTSAALIVPSPISPTFQSSSNVLSLAAYLITRPLSTSCQPNSQLTGLSIPQKLPHLSIDNDLVCAIDSGKISLFVLLDLSAAFDNVDHQILLSVLENRFSMDSTALRWFESYLTDRVQSFSYAGVQTPSFRVDCSVPQGSVLGPRCLISYK